MTPTWEDGTEPLVGGGLVQAGKVDRQVRAALAAAKEVQSDMPKIGCVGHDCAECKAREAQPTNKVTLTAPSEIWLQVSDDASDRDEAFPPLLNEEITWFHESVLGCEVKYVRADLAQPQPADPRIAALEAKCKDYEAALKRIQDPIAWEQNNLPKGYRIDGPGLMNLVGSASYYQNIAREALAKHGGAA